MFRKTDLASYRIAAAYGVAGLFYIWLSDWMVVGDLSRDWRPGADTLKGSLFVILSALLIAWLARRELRHFDQTLRASHAAQRMEALGRITSGVAHDFNNLLTLVISNAELLEQELADSPEQQASAGAILAAGERGAQLVAHLLTFARERPARLTELEIAERVAGLRPILERAAGPQIGLSFVAPDDPVRVLADIAQLDAAVLNLVINARDAMPGGGLLQIGLDVAQLEPEAAQALQLPPGAYAVLSVADTGTGMPPDVARKAFEPFFTTKEPGKGTGLGLSSVYGFLRQCGGMASIDSRPGQGTTVRLHFPLQPPHLQRGEGRAASALAAEATLPDIAGGRMTRRLAAFRPAEPRMSHVHLQHLAP